MKLDTLLERPEIPSTLGSIEKLLASLKPTLWEQELSTDEIIATLNSSFEHHLIGFNWAPAAPASSSSMYHRVGLDGGEFSTSGWIYINVCRDVDEVLAATGVSYYEDFTNALSALIGHELVHRNLLLKSVRAFNNAPDPVEFKAYLTDHREVEAYAVQAAIELLASLKVMFALTLEEFSLPVHNGSDEPWLAFNREAYLKAIDALPAEVMARFARGNTSVQNQDCITNEDLDREVAELEAQLALETEQ